MKKHEGLESEQPAAYGLPTERVAYGLPTDAPGGQRIVRPPTKARGVNSFEGWLTKPRQCCQRPPGGQPVPKADMATDKCGHMNRLVDEYA